MTDNEIIKAVECCTGNTKCCECPMFRTPNCMNKAFGYALDLINRQKAEIERLKCEMGKLLPKDCSYAMQMEVSNKLESQIKSEAIKEVAEEFEYFVLNEDIEVVEPKCKDYESYINGANQFRHQIKNGINNLVKEMTEVSE